MTKQITDNSDPRVFQYADSYGHPARRRVDPTECDTPHFSGYPVPPGSTRTVAELMTYYVQGGTAKHAPEDPEEACEAGEPVSGDLTARFRHWRATGDWPAYAAIGTPFPGPRGRYAPVLTSREVGPPPGRAEAVTLF